MAAAVSVMLLNAGSTFWLNVRAISFGAASSTALAAGLELFKLACAAATGADSVVTATAAAATKVCKVFVCDLLSGRYGHLVCAL